MSNPDRKTPPLDPDRGTAAADAGGRQASQAVAPNQSGPESVPPDESIAPFVPAKGAILDGEEVEAVRSDPNEIEPSMAANADIEYVPETAPEQIDFGADGQPVI